MNPRFCNPPGVTSMGCTLALTLAVAAACSDVTTPVSESPDPAPAAPFVHSGPGPLTASERGLLFARGSGILVTSLTGGEPTLVVDHAGLPSWSPDGSMIAFAWYGNPSVPFRWTLCVARVDGAGTRCVSKDDGDLISEAASWSPDGRRLAFSLTDMRDPLDGRPSGLYVLDVWTMEYRMVTSVPVWSLSWSPDGERIALVSPRSVQHWDDYSGSLATVRPDGSGFQTVSDGDGRYLFREVAWSPSGEQLAFILSDQSRCPMGCTNALGVASFDADSSGAALGPLRVLGESLERSGLSWSPDEAVVASVRTTCQAICVVDVMSVDVTGGTETLLVANASQPAWSR